MVQVAPTRTATEAFVIDGADKDTRHINVALRKASAEGYREIRLLNPGSKHSLAVAIFEPVHITIEGSVGYFGATMLDGAHVHITGRAGCSLGEGMMSGEIVVEKNAGSSTGAGPHILTEDTGILLIAGSVQARKALEYVGLAEQIDLFDAGGIRNG